MRLPRSFLSRKAATGSVPEKYVLENFAKLTGKHLCQNLLRPTILLKKRLQRKCFLVNFEKLLRPAFS